jgi:hypothetical protein
MSTETTSTLHQKYEPNPDPSVSTHNVSKDANYEPRPDKSIPISPQHQEIVNAITRLYSGSASESDMDVYSASAIYDDPWSYCDTRYKIAGQWYGIPKLFNSKTLAAEIVKDSPGEIIFKLRQEYAVKGVDKLGVRKTADSLVSLTLDKEAKVKYHKDMWNEKDYSHCGIGKVMKTLNGNHLTKITRPPETL